MTTNISSISTTLFPSIEETEKMYQREIYHSGCQYYTHIALTIISLSGIAIGIGLLCASLEFYVIIPLCISGISYLTDRFFFAPIKLPDPGYRLEGTGINCKHFEEVLLEEQNIPSPPANIEIDSLLRFIEKINFTDPERPDYLFERREGWHYFDVNAEALRTKLSQFIDRAREDGGDETIRYIKLIIYKFSQIQDDLHDPNSTHFIHPNDPKLDEQNEEFDREVSQRYQEQLKEINKRNRILLELSQGIQGCTNLVRMSAFEGFRKIYALQASNFGDDIKDRLKDLRWNIVTSMAREEGCWMPETLEFLLKKLGPTRGLTNQIFFDHNTFFSSFFDYSVDYDPYERFNRKYNKEIVLDLVKHWIDGMEGENGIRHREVELERATDWFKAHMLDEYRTLDPGTEYQSAEERYLYEHVYQPLDETDYPQYGIKPDAVEYLLQTIGVVN